MFSKFSVACSYQLSPNLLPKLLEKILILTQRENKKRVSFYCEFFAECGGLLQKEREFPEAKSEDTFNAKNSRSEFFAECEGLLQKEREFPEAKSGDTLNAKNSRSEFFAECEEFLRRRKYFYFIL